MKKCPSCGYREPKAPPKPRLRQQKKATWRRERDGHVHEYLVGWQDHLRRRLEIYRAAGGEATWFDENDPNSVEDLKAANCQGCAETHEVGWLEGEWHHTHGTKGGRRCDCIQHALWVCADWHKAFHDRVIAVKQIGNEAA